MSELVVVIETTNPDIGDRLRALLVDDEDGARVDAAGKVHAVDVSVWTGTPYLRDDRAELVWTGDYVPATDDPDRAYPATDVASGAPLCSHCGAIHDPRPCSAMGITDCPCCTALWESTGARDAAAAAFEAPEG